MYFTFSISQLKTENALRSYAGTNILRAFIFVNRDCAGLNMVLQDGFNVAVIVYSHAFSDAYQAHLPLLTS